MTYSEPSRITVYGCEPDEAALIRELAPGSGVLAALTEEPLSAANARLAEGSRCISVGHKSRVSREALDAVRRAGVSYISTRSIGCNHIDVAYAREIGITVGNVSYSPDSVADYTLLLMLMAVRDAKSTVRRTDLHDYRLSERRGRELRDLTVGVVGTGRIGRAVMARLRGFGCRILAYDSRPGAGAAYVSLDELLRASDLVTLHAPLTEETHHLLNRERLARMKSGALVVNTGRGGLIDTEALVSALESGQLGGAALDVVEGEEGVFYADCRNSVIENKAILRLQEMPQAIVTPHTAYYTDHALRDTVENSLANCLAFEREKQYVQA
ncbi:D-isomer specific 2-hydroxyacid dehydrogenase family protein [Streptomyces indicus]|uniref:D-specific alpha-keto acid dehydrogenase n=1 Tax=Streptomyces indicus TaxID=417292 RepID=A0A1G9H7G4_9ACTN|nr:D-isomer specific 2-hydroxyacid dehydrogenase family protein [Streptomyces indicus]SDL08795.1 D-specific alpha-keto acid dehydrogenase [Streptomyces indicus]